MREGGKKGVVGGEGQVCPVFSDQGLVFFAEKNTKKTRTFSANWQFWSTAAITGPTCDHPPILVTHPLPSVNREPPSVPRQPLLLASQPPWVTNHPTF